MPRQRRLATRAVHWRMRAPACAPDHHWGAVPQHRRRGGLQQQADGSERHGHHPVGASHVSTWLNTYPMRFRVIDGLSIRYAESEHRDVHALLLSPWLESLLAFDPIWRQLAEL